MSRFFSLLWPRPHAIWGYGIAVLSVIVALILSRWPAFHLEAAPVSLFLCAVMFSAWFGGAGPGLLAIVLSALAFDYYFLPPVYALTLKPQEVPRLVIFVMSAFFVGALSAAQRTATESLRRARDDLKGTVLELQRTNEALRAESIERRQTEDKLRRSEAYLAEAQRLSHTGSWASRPATGEILYFSEECYRLVGLDPRDGSLRYETFLQRVHPDDRARLSEAVETSGREKTEFELDYRIVHPGGGIRDIHVLGHPVPGPSGDFVEFVGTLMDVTERRRADAEREKLHQAQADLAHVSRVTTLGELTASLTHEVSQPITAAVTNAKTCLLWLNRETPDLEEAREAAMRILKDGTRAAAIISRIRLLFRKGTPHRELVDINEVVREMIVLLRGEAMRHSISIHTELAADLPEIMADPVQLQQVMMNLMVNGIDAMKTLEGPHELAIRSQHGENERLMVSVSDTGVGLPPEQREQIFNAFITTKPHGTGMGLSISRSIVEAHGGRIWAADNSPRGASFFLTLPTEIEVHE